MSRKLAQRLGLILLASAFHLAPLQARGDDAEDQYAVAAGHYSQQRWKMAVEEFQAFLKAHPNHPQANGAVFFLAEALFQLERFDPAELRYREYLQREPAGRFVTSALFRVGETAYLQGKLDRAKPDLERFLAKFPEHPLGAYVLPYLGDIALLQGDDQAAARCFRQGLARFPQGRFQDNCRLGLARALEKQGQLQEAERLYLAVAAKTGSPLADDAQFRLGALQYTLGNYAEAVTTLEAFETKWAASPQKPNARLCRGWALFNLRRLDEAKQLFASLTADSSVGVVARYWLGLTEKAQQDWTAAATTLRAAADVDPRHKLVPALRFHAGDALLRAGDARAACRQFDQVLAAEQPDPEWADRAALGRIQAALMTKDFESLQQQVAQFDARFAQSPLKPDVRRTLARSLLDRRIYPRAVQVLEPLLAAGAQQVESLEDRYLLALAYEGMKRYEDALAALLPVLESAQGRLKSDAQRAQGSLLVTLQRFSEAAETFDRLLQQNPPAALAAEAAFARGQILEQLDKLDPALAMYDLVIDRYDKTDQYPKALLAAARLYSKLQQYPQAAALLERLATQFPRLPELHTVLYEWSSALQDSGKQAESQKLLVRLYQEYRQSRLWPDVTCRLARQALDAKDYARADALASEALQGNPDPKIREHILYLQGESAAAQQRWDQARQVFEAFLKQFPRSTTRLAAEYWIAEAIYRQGDYEAAGKRFDHLATQTQGRHDPWLAMVPLRRAQVFGHKKQWNEAYEIASKIESEYPNFEQQYEADYLIGRCLAGQADFEGARQAYLKVIRSPVGAKTETAAMAQWMIGETYFHQNNHEAALREYLRLETLYAYPRWQAGALLQAGKCHELLGQWQEAAQVYQRLLKVYPNTPFTEEANRRLQMAQQRTAAGVTR